MSETAPKTSLKADSVACVKTVKLIMNVAPEAMSLQLIAFKTLLLGLSLSKVLVSFFESISTIP